MLHAIYSATGTQIVRIIVQTLAIFAGTIALTRITGLRSFSKMSSFDFAMTVAIGTVLSSTALGTVSLVIGLLALAVLYAAQAGTAFVRRRSEFVKDLVDNEPLLLMKDGQLLEPNMAAVRVTKDDIMSKLRDRNACDISKVHAVVLETTGDVSVLYGDIPPDPRLLEHVRNSAG